MHRLRDFAARQRRTQQLARLTGSYFASHCPGCREMKSYDEITAELRQKREQLEEHFRNLAETSGATDVLEKLRELRERGEKMKGPKELEPGP